jgi:hypothetical protein
VVALSAALQPLLVARIADPQAQQRAIAGIIAAPRARTQAMAFNDVFLMLTAFSAVVGRQQSLR